MVINGPNCHSYHTDNKEFFGHGDGIRKEQLFELNGKFMFQRK
jgi:hypothetical protein